MHTNSGIDLALGFVERAKNLKTSQAISREVHLVLGQYGFDKLTICALPDGIDTARDTMLLNSRPDEYVSRYIDEGHQLHDPVISALYTETHVHS